MSMAVNHLDLPDLLEFSTAPEHGRQKRVEHCNLPEFSTAPEHGRQIRVEHCNLPEFSTAPEHGRQIRVEHCNLPEFSTAPEHGSHLLRVVFTARLTLDFHQIDLVTAGIWPSSNCLEP